MAHINELKYEEKRNKDGSIYGNGFSATVTLQEGEIPYPLSSTEKFDAKVVESGQMLIKYVRQQLDSLKYETAKEMHDRNPARRSYRSSGGGSERGQSRGGSREYPHPTEAMMKKIKAIDAIGPEYQTLVDNFLALNGVTLETITGNQASDLIDRLEALKQELGDN